MARKKPTYEQLKSEYRDLWDNMKIKASWASGAARIATRIRNNKHRYQEISRLCGGNIPWQFIGVIHNCESGCNFDKHLHNGDSLQQRTRRVPANRPKKGKPPFTFEESAVDALQMKGYHKIIDWPIERVLYELERYNGFGYRMYHPDTLSPYLWSGTPYYTRGKYVADGKWSSTAVSAQGGCAPVLKLLDVKKVIKENSTTKQTTDKVEKVTWLTGIGGAILTFLGQVKEVASNNIGIVILIGAVAVGGVIWYVNKKREKEVEDGTYIPSGLVEHDDELA